MKSGKGLPVGIVRHRIYKLEYLIFLKGKSERWQKELKIKRFKSDDIDLKSIQIEFIEIKFVQCKNTLDKLTEDLDIYEKQNWNKR
jgi:hypothetical protein